MIHSGVLQLMRADAGGIDSLRDKGVNISKFRIADFQINSTQNVDGLRHRFPVERGVIVKMEIQIFFQSSHCLGVAALKISLIDFMVGAVRINL